MNIPKLTDTQRQVVADNLGLIHKMARAMHVPDDEYDDAIQDGVFGLARASQKYDPERGYAFSTYAMFWIRHAIQRGKGIREGINYRTSLDYNAGSLREQRPFYNEPVSLEQELRNAGGDGDHMEGVTVGAHIPAPGPSVEEQVETLLMLDSVIDIAGEKQALDLLAMPSGTEVAAAEGVSREAIRQRRNRWRERVAERLAERMNDEDAA